MNHQAVLHIDGDDFFAELIRLKNPHLRKRPVIIGNLKSRGSVIAASYEARQSGITPGLTMQQAARICPDAVLEQIDWDIVHKASRTLLKLLNQYSPLIKPVGADAAFLDYSGCHNLFGSAPDFAIRLQRKIYEEMSITASIGLSPDKAVSAVACRSAKRGSFLAVNYGQERLFLSECPLIWLPGIDVKLSSYFAQLGVLSIGDMARIPIELMEHILGNQGRRLSLRAQGSEHAVVRPYKFSSMTTASESFAQDRIQPDQILARMAILASKLGFSLRSNRQSVRTLIVKLEYIDGPCMQRQILLRPASNRDPDIFSAAREVFCHLYSRRVRVRKVELLARYVIPFVPELPMGEAAVRAKWDRVMIAVDKAHKKYSSYTVQLGAALSTGSVNN
ncbi:hypothetical protein K8T06_01880 [bacterium]|nr:hypothetical protein [bacterium]